MDTRIFSPDINDICIFLTERGSGSHVYVYENEQENIYFSVDLDFLAEYTSTRYDYDTPPEYTLMDFSLSVGDVECYDAEGEAVSVDFDENELYNAVYDYCK